VSLKQNVSYNNDVIYLLWVYLYSESILAHMQRMCLSDLLGVKVYVTYISTTGIRKCSMLCVMHLLILSMSRVAALRVVC